MAKLRKLPWAVPKLFEKAVEGSAIIIGLANGLATLAIEVRRLAENVAVLAHNQHVHSNVLNQLYNAQVELHHRMRASSLDMSMPDIDAKKPAAEEAADGKPAAVRPEDKPN